MFFIAGIHSKVKSLGDLHACECPACGENVRLHVTKTYITPHVFFIPTIHLRRRYIASCPRCASLMDLCAEKGSRMNREPDVHVDTRDMTVIQHNHNLRR